MSQTIRATAVACQANLDTHDHDARGKFLSLVRASIDESGWKYAAVAASLGVEPAYLSRMLSGEKPWSLVVLQRLPDDITIIFARRLAEGFGLIVVQPVDSDQAIKHLVSGLLGVLLSPTRARMAKAGLR